MLQYCICIINKFKFKSINAKLAIHVVQSSKSRKIYFLTLKLNIFFESLVLAGARCWSSLNDTRFLLLRLPWSFCASSITSSSSSRSLVNQIMTPTMRTVRKRPPPTATPIKLVMDSSAFLL